ncbi:hypothetical protein LEP1GSC008_3209 [Leptospira kirschneri serovar Bulgarica str. Nikolaevo]|uniref:Uncharacterized protein n=1 Tax=Leptospira kirschneri serovar Bulgarica str. Nikolaevo TaxID=1240687 RepID=M6FLB9_9LEPT|nr:hypothetical protein LEP1GSC008_3209 [Leptospira kirschneri serovar Bulgarica str. Nikolaevo]
MFVVHTGSKFSGWRSSFKCFLRFLKDTEALSFGFLTSKVIELKFS